MFKNEFELKMDVKFSKNGIIKIIEELLNNESPDNMQDPDNAKKWDNLLKSPGI